MSKKQCARCGDCCSRIPCGIGFAVFGDVRPCPALESGGDIHSCGLVIHASEYIDIGGHEDMRNQAVSMLVRIYLGIGEGCGNCSTTMAIGQIMKKGMEQRRA